MVRMKYEVEYIQHMGSDLTVVNAARVSFKKESKYICNMFESDCNGHNCICKDGPSLSNQDQKLIKYLAKHNHWTPFGHCQVTFRIKAPIFVARQLGKHQVGMVWNEVSRRYVDSEPEFFSIDMFREKADNVKQGSKDEATIPYSLDPLHHYTLECYNNLLKMGVCPEQARMVLPQSMYTEWYWTGSLAAWARVCKLRLDPHTQKETRDIAQVISNQMSIIFPVSWSALLA